MVKMTVAMIEKFLILVNNEMGPDKLAATPFFSVSLCDSPALSTSLFLLISSSLQVKLSMNPSLLLFLRSQKKWIILTLSPRSSSINSTFLSPWSVHAASCYLTA